MFFLDVNILLDMIDFSRSTAQKSMNFLKNNPQGVYACSEDMISTFFYITKKSYSNEQIIHFWESFQKKAMILPFGKKVLTSAFLYCKQNPSADLEDVLQAYCAKEHGCDALITNDISFPADILPLRIL